MTRRCGWAILAIALAASLPMPLDGQAQQSPPVQQQAPPDQQQASPDQPQSTTADQLQDAAKPKKSERGITRLPAEDEIRTTLIRVPIAAVLGTILALRPRRRGTPARQPAVIQTQIILAIVGAVVMLIVGTSLARAFGIVGAAGLVRYRAKIEDPKDAGVMLTTLAVGLASGVGLYGIAVASTGFILLTLWLIESFEPDTRRTFDLKISMGKDADAHRGQFEEILRRNHIDFDLIAASDDQVTYEVLVPFDVARDRVSNALLKLDPAGHSAVDWVDKKLKAK